MEQRNYSDSIYWVEVDRIHPNPFQPRRTFDDDKLTALADSIRQYGVLQPLVVTKKETERPGEGLFVEYELIAGERRLKAAKRAGVSSVPVVIRSHEESDKMKLELAIIENLQREDLNPIDRAKAFQQLAVEFGLKHTEIAKKIGKSREYVSNNIRMLSLPNEMQEALITGDITDGHTRPLLMLATRPEQQQTLFREILDKKMTVRESERVARRIAVDRARKQDLTPELLSLEKEFTEALGTRVHIEKKDEGGKVLIDFFSQEDLNHLRDILARAEHRAEENSHELERTALSAEETSHEMPHEGGEKPAEEHLLTESATEDETPEPEEDLYSVRNFSV